MDAYQLNRASTIGLVVLSLTALMTERTMSTTYSPFAETDEGTAAHIFQLSIAGVALFGLLYTSTADWKQPLRVAQQLAFPALAVALAFGILFYFEQVYLPAHGFPPPRPGLPLRALRQLLAAVR